MMMLLATKVKKGEKTKVLFFLPNEKDFPRPPAGIGFTKPCLVN